MLCGAAWELRRCCVVLRGCCVGVVWCCVGVA